MNRIICDDLAYLCRCRRGFPANLLLTITVLNFAPQPPDSSTTSYNIKDRQFTIQILNEGEEMSIRPKQIIV